MSRVTKLKKLYRRLNEARRERWRRNYTKGRRIRRAQGGKLRDWEPGHRTPVRGTWNVIACRCGHKRHGKYGCMKGCAWAECGSEAPLMLSPIYDDGLLMREFEAIRSSRVAAICSAFALPSGQKVLLIGDSHITDLVGKELDKLS